MCLSDVYVLENGTKKLLYKNVASVRQKEDKLVFSDILGNPQEIKGTIASVDLLENIIIINGTKEEEL